MVVGLAVAIGSGLVAVLVGLAASGRLPLPRRQPPINREAHARRILLPFTGTAISGPALEAAVRLAKAENAVVIPAFLARIPRRLPLDTPLPRQCEGGMPLLVAIEQRAAATGVAVDSRISRGRSYRDALTRLMDDEIFDRIIISPTSENGLSIRDLQWLLRRTPGELMILRPAPTDERRITGAALA
jgi:hypothetical protein